MLARCGSSCKSLQVLHACNSRHRKEAQGGAQGILAGRRVLSCLAPENHCAIFAVGPIYIHRPARTKVSIRFISQLRWSWASPGRSCSLVASVSFGWSWASLLDRCLVPWGE
jgi:hypothetical protein